MCNVLHIEANGIVLMKVMHRVLSPALEVLDSWGNC